MEEKDGSVAKFTFCLCFITIQIGTSIQFQVWFNVFDSYDIARSRISVFVHRHLLKLNNKNCM